MDTKAEHVHILIAYPPKLSLSMMVNNLKSISSRCVRILNTHLRKGTNSGVLWLRSYFTCSAGVTKIEKTRAYVQSQEIPSLRPYIHARLGDGLRAFC